MTDIVAIFFQQEDQTLPVYFLHLNRVLPRITLYARTKKLTNVKNDIKTIQNTINYIAIEAIKQPIWLCIRRLGLCITLQCTLICLLPKTLYSKFLLVKTLKELKSLYRGFFQLKIAGRLGLVSNHNTTCMHPKLITLTIDNSDKFIFKH